MTLRKKNSYLYYIIWLIIATLLLHFGNEIVRRIEAASSSYFTVVWVSALIPFIYGLHLALLEGLPRRFEMNLPMLLFVFLPSFFILCYPIFAIAFEIHLIQFLAYVSDRTLILLSGIISGASLIKSLFQH